MTPTEQSAHIPYLLPIFVTSFDFLYPFVFIPFIQIFFFFFPVNRLEYIKNERTTERKNTRERNYKGDFLCVSLHLAEVEFAIPMTKEHLANIYRIIRFEHPNHQINFQVSKCKRFFFFFFRCILCFICLKLKSKSGKKI